MVQAAHAAQKSGATFGCPDNCHMVICGVKDQEQLLKFSEKCLINNVKFELFFEPDEINNEVMGYSAFCTCPIYDEQRKVFKNCKILS